MDRTFTLGWYSVIINNNTICVPWSNTNITIDESDIARSFALMEYHTVASVTLYAQSMGINVPVIRTVDDLRTACAAVGIICTIIENSEQYSVRWPTKAMGVTLKYGYGYLEHSILTFDIEVWAWIIARVPYIRKKYDIAPPVAPLIHTPKPAHGNNNILDMIWRTVQNVAGVRSLSDEKLKEIADIIAIDDQKDAEIKLKAIKENVDLIGVRVEPAAAPVAPVAAPAAPKPKPLPVAIAAEKEDDECVVCLENKKQFIAIACGHYSYCEVCQSELTDCAICRKPTKFIKVYT